MEKGLVSIIIGVHNEKEEHLRMAFNSLFNQSYQNIEIIVIDDDSDDNCKSVLNDICNGIKNITIVHNKTNLGLTKSLNIGLQMAKGEFIARMDADDYSTYNRIEKQVDYLKYVNKKLEHDNKELSILLHKKIRFMKEMRKLK